MMLETLQSLAASPGQHLTTLRASPSTVKYTASTRTAPRTVLAVVAYYAALAARVLFGLSALYVLLAKRSAETGSCIFIWSVLGTQTRAWAGPMLASASWTYLLPAVAAVLWVVLQRGYTEESLLVVQDLGVQTSTTSSTFLRTPSTRFIPKSDIQDIFIHEAFIGFEVRFYLAIVVKGEEDVVVVFPRSLPRRPMLETVWKGSRACLYGVDAPMRSQKG